VKRHEVICRLCQIVGMVYQAQGDFTHASDCFCDDPPPGVHSIGGFRHEGKTLDYVEQAVREQLKRDGYEVPAA
jgi:hypothetical protein